VFTLGTPLPQGEERP